MLRRLFTLVSAVSLVMCMATVALLSYSLLLDEWADLRLVGPDRTYAVGRWRGTLTFQAIGPFPGDFRGNRNTAWGNDPWAPSRRLGFSYSSGSVGVGWTFDNPVETPVTLHIVQAPAWVAVAVPALMPVAWGCAAVVRRRRVRRRPGVCPLCGYDLRATPDRCPECGKMPAKT